jgi:hypothetical protein
MEASGQLHVSIALPSGKELPILIGQEAGWDTEQVPQYSLHTTKTTATIAKHIHDVQNSNGEKFPM